MLYSTARWLLEHMDPVRANRVMINNLEWYTTLEMHKDVSRVPDEDPVTVMGVRFPNAVGLAAGLDRNGAQVSSFGAFGFGFVEIGTVTSKAQAFTSAHPIVRLDGGASIAHATEFENDGCEAALKVLKSADAFHLRGGVTGVSIGACANQTPDAVAGDLASLLAALYHRADYFTLNLFCSTPKDPGAILRDAKFLEATLRTLVEERNRQSELPAHAHLARRPLVAKLPAFLTDDDMKRAADVCAAAGIDGIAAGGPLLADAKGVVIDSWANAQELPASFCLLSGAAVRERSTQAVALLSRHLAGALPLIASGGVLRAEDAKEKIEAGASLVQILTGFLKNGPAFVADCVDAAAEARHAAAGV